MYVCNSCKGDTVSRSNRMRASTCDDCTKDNPITPGVPSTCICSDVGHDKSKIPKIKPFSKSLESEMNDFLNDGKEINRDRSSDAEKK